MVDRLAVTSFGSKQLARRTCPQLGNQTFPPYVPPLLCKHR
uniref:Uncharacterized protein n=1 Tax=Anopheles atroparvus TaxID=41427 RepID=A0AAG5D740_ANOAO